MLYFSDIQQSSDLTLILTLTYTLISLLAVLGFYAWNWYSTESDFYVTKCKCEYDLESISGNRATFIANETYLTIKSMKFSFFVSCISVGLLVLGHLITLFWNPDKEYYVLYQYWVFGVGRKVGFYCIFLSQVVSFYPRKFSVYNLSKVQAKTPDFKKIRDDSEPSNEDDHDDSKEEYVSTRGDRHDSSREILEKSLKVELEMKERL